jgi:hypothetical protein
VRNVASEVERSVIDALLACLPLSDDGTGHIADCGYTEDAPSCGCLALPGQLAAVIAAHDAEVAARALREAAEELECGPECSMGEDCAYADAASIVRARADALAASQGAGESGEGER